MKKAILFLMFSILALLQVNAQSYLVQLINNGNGQFRFERLEIRQYDDFSDTLSVDRFPGKWLDSTELKAFQLQVVGGLEERKTELRRLFNLVKNEMDIHVNFYDSINGEGAFLAYQKNKILESLNGNWVMVDRNGEIKKENIVINGTEFKKNNNKKGVITVNDELQVVVSGYLNFDLIFDIQQNGNLKYQKNNNRLFILRR